MRIFNNVQAARSVRGSGHGPNVAQLHTLAHLPGDLSQVDYSIYAVFYGFDMFCVAYLVLKSTFLPRFIGVLLAVDGLGYLVYRFTFLLAPGVAAHLVPWIQLPVILDEGSLCLWLLIVGIDNEVWNGWWRTYALDRASAPVDIG
jgi:hypothetical protein